MKNFLLRNKKTILLVFAVTVAVACVSKILFEYQWASIWAGLREADFSLLIVGSALSIVFYWLCRALRWQVLLRNDGIALPFWQIYLVTGVSVGSSTVTPFQSGEALKVEYLKKHSAAAGRLPGYTIFFIERFFDLLTVAGLGVLCVWLGFDFGVSRSYFYGVGVFFVAGAAGLIGFVFLFPSERLSRFRILLREKQQQKGALFAAFLLTIFSWLMVIVGWKIALSSVSINIDFLQASSVVSLTALLVIISFVPGAVGVAELGISTILTKMGVESSLAQTGAIAVRGYTLVILGLTILHWIILKILSKKFSTGVIE